MQRKKKTSRQSKNNRLSVALLAILACTGGCSAHDDPGDLLIHATRTFQHGDIRSAEEEAKKGYLEFRGKRAEWAWRFLILEADALQWQGRTPEVLNLLAAEKSQPSTEELTAQKDRLQAVAYAVGGSFGEAESSLAAAERICSTAAYPACARIVAVRGWIELERGDFEGAEGLYEQARGLAHSRDDKFQEASALLSLSHAGLEQTHFDQALFWASAARQISLAQGYADISETALGNLGWAYYKLGDPEKAEAMFTDARRQAQTLGDITDQIRWTTDGAYIDLDAGKLAAAERSYRESLALAQKIQSREDIFNARQALAFVSEQTGKLDDAKRYADESLAMAQADKNGRDQVYPELVQGRLAARAHDTSTAENTFREVARSPDCPVFLKWEAQRSLARLYEDENHLDSADGEYRTALTTFEAARSVLEHEDSRLPFLSNASHIYDDYIHFLVIQGKSAEALQVADFSRGRTLAEGLGLLQKGTSFDPERLDAREVARRAGGTIFFYWLGEKQSYVWVITAKKISLFALPAAAEIESGVDRYQKALHGPQDVLQSGDAGTALYRMLIGPARDLLPANAKVVIIPDGKLNNLNFETLVVPDPAPHFWIEDVTVTNANSLRLLAASRTAKNKGGRSLLLFGDAVSASPEYPELANAPVEMKGVEKHFPAAQERIFQRDEATPAAYLASEPKKFSYIHFVAHGMASRSSPLDSAIILSKNAGQNENFKLYARDIIQHPVRAELVTISACYGAGTRAYSGEGLVGLSWAFLHSGAHNVVAALWEASDVSTSQLMDKFYDELNRGKTPDKALREAKLSLLHSDNAFRKPLYWGPFQLYSGL
jgi:CHAT domain-containing protein